jgi:VWFA-related protein
MYSDSVNQFADFTHDRPALSNLILKLKPPETSETNLYDVVIFATQRMRQVKGRKAILLVSSGIDTFSKATFDDAVKAARQSDAPIYVISLGPSLKQAARLRGVTAVSFDWNAGEKPLAQIAEASGGRFYSPRDTVDVSGICGDIIENLKVRYVITYHSMNHADPSVPRTVRVELVEPETGKPLTILDANGRLIHPNVIAEGSYTPALELEAGARHHGSE